MSKIIEWSNGWEKEPFESEKFDLMVEEKIANEKINQVRIFQSGNVVLFDIQKKNLVTVMNNNTAMDIAERRSFVRDFINVRDLLS